MAGVGVDGDGDAVALRQGFFCFYWYEDAETLGFRSFSYSLASKLGKI